MISIEEKMKKILTIALVALIAASSVFAGLSGYSYLGFGYNSQSGKFGFSPESALSIDLDVATADGSNVGEGDVYAGIDGSIALRLVDTADSDVGKLIAVYPYNDGNDTGYYSVGVFASINSAYIAGKDWKVSFGTASLNPVDFAKSAIDTYTTQLKDEYEFAYWTKSASISYKAPYSSTSGFVAEYKDYKVGVGFEGKKVLQRQLQDSQLMLLLLKSSSATQQRLNSVLLQASRTLQTSMFPQAHLFREL